MSRYPTRAMGSFVLLLLVASCLMSNTVTAAIAVPSTSSTKNQKKFPAARLVDLKLYHVEEDVKVYKKINDTNESLRFDSFLKRRDGITLYGKSIMHGPEEPSFAHLSVRMPDDRHVSGDGWDATMLLTPDVTDIRCDSGDTCFVAMNRFSVKHGCEEKFEERWAERNSRLPFQAGFLGFSLLRRRSQLEHQFNYSTLTLWASYGAWTGWRSGEGRSSHDISRKSNRTPVSEWLASPASPIFWDGFGVQLADGGV